MKSSSSDRPVIRLLHLSKSYGKHRGIDDLTLDVHAGEVLGFLGPNGAGKTTAIRTLMGFLRPSAGMADVAGMNVTLHSVEVRKVTGYLPGDPAFYSGRTGWDLLHLSLRARGLSEGILTERVVKALGAPMDRDVKKCSRGMRQKIALVVALAHDPQVLILDEPTGGLDPLGQRALLEIIDERARAGRTVLLSSHILSEVEQVCHRVAILSEGRLSTLSTVEALRSQKYKEVTVAFDGPAPDLTGVGEVEVIWEHEGRMTFRVRGDSRQLLRALAASNVTDVSITEPSLEEVFLDYYRSGETS